MKKYLLSTLAIALALICTALSLKESEGRTNVFLSYTGTGYSESQVEDETKWVEGDISHCDDVDEKACGIIVNASDLVGTAPNRTLRPGCVIQGQFHVGCGTWYVVVGGCVVAVRNTSC